MPGDCLCWEGEGEGLRRFGKQRSAGFPSLEALPCA